MRQVGALLMLAMVIEGRPATAQPPPAPADAEYAVRWKVADGGPQTAKAVVAALAVDSEPSEEFTVEYFKVERRPADAPQGAEAILRRRTSQGQTQLTFKYRSKPPIAATCPLADAETKYEADVTFTDAVHTERSNSYSCDVKGDAGIFEPNLHLMALGCTAHMKRLKTKKKPGIGKLTVEEWTLGSTVVIEVSSGGKNNNDATAEQEFRQSVVEKLIDVEKITPLPQGMTTLTTECVPPP